MKRTFAWLITTVLACCHPLFALDTAFTYQGRLNDSNGPAGGAYDFRFVLFDSITNGAVVGNALTNTSVPVSNGLFRVQLDFGSAPFAPPFNTNLAWLEMGVRPAGSSNAFTDLAPRQRLGGVPYAVQANLSLSYAGSIADAQLSPNIARLDSSATFSSGVTAASLGGSNVASPVFTSRSPGEALTLKAANGTGNGGALNIAAGDAGTANGGAGGNLSLQAGSAVPQGGSGYLNQGPAGAVSIVAGNGYNGVGGDVTLRSGFNSPWTTLPDRFSKISLQGGTLNTGDGATLDVEGAHSVFSNGLAVSSGGNVRVSSGNGVGGEPAGNILLLPGTGGPNGNVGIGKSNPATLLDVNGTVSATNFNGSGAGLSNVNAALLSGNIPDSKLSANVALLNASQTFNNAVTVNSNLVAARLLSSNVTSRTAGESLQVKAANGTGNGGALTMSAGDAGTATGGAGGNVVLQAGSAVPQGGSGYANQGLAGAVTILAGGGYNGVGGGILLRSGPNSPWSLTPDGFSKVSLQGGTLNNGDAAALDVEGGHNINSSGSAISRGGNVRISSGNGVGGYPGGNILLLPGTGATNGNVGIGKTNPATALDVNGTVTALALAGPNLTSRTPGEALQVKAANGAGNGGALTIAAGDAGTPIGGGGGNLTLQAGSAVPQGGSGYFNQGPPGAVNINAGGGYNGVGGNIVLHSGFNSPWSLTGDGYSKISLQGGTLNSGDGGVIEVEGGHNIDSSGSAISRGGNVRITTGNGVGGFSGGNILLLPGTGTPAGRVGIGTNNPTALLQVGSATCDGTTWANGSDRDSKENFQPVNAREVLAKVAALPITRWNYKAQPQQEHVGPVAQDFAAAFQVGADDKHIATVDADGVALAAIQGLNEVVTHQAAELKQKQMEIDLLRQRLERLERLLRADSVEK